MTTKEREEGIERLVDLRHDLGKHVRLPLALLPAGAGPDEVREALATGLLRTRRGPTGTVSARALWEAFRAAVGDGLADADGWAPLCAAVERALAWERALAPDALPVERAVVDAELAAVGTAIRALLAEVAHG